MNKKIQMFIILIVASVLIIPLIAYGDFISAEAAASTCGLVAETAEIEATTAVVEPTTLPKTEYDLDNHIKGSYLILVPSLNMRAEHSSGAQVVALIPYGTLVPVSEIFKDGETYWGKTVYGGHEGWIMLKYAEFADYYTNFSTSQTVLKLCSAYEKEIDWSKVVSDSIDAVMLRIGTYNTASKTMVEDTRFGEYYTGIKKTNLSVGCFFTSGAANAAEAKAEAEWVLKKITDNKLIFDMPIFLDMSNIENNLSAAVLDEIIAAFTKVFIDERYFPGVFCSAANATNKIDMLKLSGCAVWINEVGATCSYKGRYDMWLNNDTGELDSLEGDLALSLSYVDYPLFLYAAGLNRTALKSEHYASEWVEKKAPTCSTPGLRSLPCKHCEQILLSEYIKPTAHKNLVWSTKIQPTATAEGLAEARCSDCQLLIETQVIPSLNPTHYHTHGDWVDGEKSSCFLSGTRYLKCGDPSCGATFVTAFVPTSDHIKASEVITPATCTESGLGTVKCKDCGIVLSERYIDPLGHRILNWETVKQQTPIAQGEIKGKCIICGESVTKEIPKLEALMGDLNYDGDITAIEARMVLRFSAELDTLTDKEKAVADMDSDGKITATDARIILRKSAGLD